MSLVWLLLLAAAPAADSPSEQRVGERAIAQVWSGHPVQFCLLTADPWQYVAYYDDQRRMTVASRRLDSEEWQYTQLPTQVGWDSHNYVTMALDQAGHLHLAGNMHCVPLIYFRSTRPFDATTLACVPAMVGKEENRCTYPRFLSGAGGELLFTYRDGSSGNGNQIWNIYRPAEGVWQRLLDRPLFSGEGKMNAYFHGPVRDRSGMFHICWVWRDTPDCATNHDLCYARSPDLVHWEKSNGEPLALPITLASAEIVDPVPPGGGIINGNAVVGFDSQDRPVLTYHKYDAAGKTQLYNARLEGGVWRRVQASDWDYRWEFSGGGSIGFEIGVGAVTLRPDGSLAQSYRHPKAGSGCWLLDPATLKPAGPAPPERQRPAEIGRRERDWPGMRVHTAADSGAGPDPRVTYLLKWETLGPNRDRPHPEPLPPASTLKLLELR